MNILIIYAHPNHDSFNGAILKTIRENISSDHQVKLLDLYAENFDPVLRFDKEKKRRDLDKDPETASYRKDITWADKLIFIYPIWWSGMPAILKGYIDRVFVAGFAYSYKKVGIGLEGHLTGKSAWIITSHANPSFIAHHFVQDYGKILKNQILKYYGISPIERIEFANVEKTSASKLKKELDKLAVKTKQL